MSILESIVEKHADDEILQCVAEVMSYFTTNVAVSLLCKRTLMQISELTEIICLFCSHCCG